MRTLIVIPARKGSKGLPGKNLKPLADKPLIAYSIEFAKMIKKIQDEICISSNDDSVLELAKQYGMEIPFKRPEYLATDQVGTYEVIMHAVDHYESLGKSFDTVLLLQPTSPIRLEEDYQAMLDKYDVDTDMVVTVKIAKENPYFTLFEEDQQGYLRMSKSSNYTRRQDCPPVYAYNGSMYLVNLNALKLSNFQGFKKIKKQVLPDERSIDIDSMQDWVIAEYFINKFHEAN